MEASNIDTIRALLDAGADLHLSMKDRVGTEQSV
jgi:hypothetical protein